MHRRSRLLAAAALAASVAGAHAAPRYALEILGRAVQADQARGKYHIDARGVVSGTASRHGRYHCVVYDHGDVRDLGDLGGHGCQVSGMGADGTVVGTSKDAAGYWHAFRHDRAGMADLGTWAGDTFSVAVGVNARGDVVGNSFSAGGRERVFLSDGARFVNVSRQAGYRLLEATGLNASGAIVGTGDTPAQARHAFVCVDDVVTDLGTLPGAEDDVLAGVAINNHGQVVGTSQGAGGALHGFLWEGGTMKDLGLLGDAPNAATGASDINDSGWVVGLASYGAGHGGKVGYLYDGAGLHDLNTLIPNAVAAHWRIVSAGGINANGQIAAVARSRDGADKHVVVLLTPVD